MEQAKHIISLQALENDAKRIKKAIPFCSESTKRKTAA
jgi:hypothetical protein